MSQIRAFFEDVFRKTEEAADAVKKGVVDAAKKATDIVHAVAEEMKVKKIIIEPANPSIVIHGQMWLFARGLIPGGKTLDLTEKVFWTAKPADIVTIDDVGTVHAREVLGTVRIRAKHKPSGAAGSTTLTVQRPGPGAHKIDVQIQVFNFRGEPMWEEGEGTAVFSHPDVDVKAVTVSDSIDAGIVKFPNLWLMSEGSLLFQVQHEWGFVTGRNQYGPPKKSGILSFTAKHVAKTETIKAKTQEEAIEKAGAPGKVGENIEVINLGDEADGESKWQVTWGTAVYDVKQD